MYGEGFFLQALTYLTAAVVSVPIAKRLGLGSVLGYLLAGVAIGPFVLGLVGEDGQDVLHFAEFGVVLMLFLIGLELEPARVWSLRAPILGLGGSQVAVTTITVAVIGALFGLAWRPALAIGLSLALSSTAIVLQTLSEKGLLRTAGGRSAFSVLLFQDIAVIPILALLPLLATAGRAHHAADEAITVPPGSKLFPAGPRRWWSSPRSLSSSSLVATCYSPSFVSSPAPACASCLRPPPCCWSSPPPC